MSKKAKKDRQELQATMGNHIAVMVWQWITDQLAVELVPWNNDPVDQAQREGYRQAVLDLQTFIMNESNKSVEAIRNLANEDFQPFFIQTTTTGKE